MRKEKFGMMEFGPDGKPKKSTEEEQEKPKKFIKVNPLEEMAKREEAKESEESRMEEIRQDTAKILEEEEKKKEEEVSEEEKEKE